MFAKTLVQTPYFWGLYRPLREQAGSHETCITMSATARECSYGRSALDLESAVQRGFVTQSVTRSHDDAERRTIVVQANAE